MGIVLYYINQDWEIKSLTLKCIPFDENHTGVNIQEKVKGSHTNV